MTTLSILHFSIKKKSCITMIQLYSTNIFYPQRISEFPVEIFITCEPAGEPSGL